MGLSYFWDTYALIEFIHGNKNFSKFINEPIIITVFNLAELFWIALREYSEKQADKIYNDHKNCVVKIDDETLKQAIRFRKKVYSRKKISYADAIGYIYAERNNLKFLTGDMAFFNLDNVEFVQ